MARITDAEQRAQDEFTALKTRVTNHEQALKDNAAAIQQVADDLKAGNLAADAAADQLGALADDMKNFDPDAAPVDTGTPPADTGTGSGDTGTPPADGGTAGDGGTPTP